MKRFFAAATIMITAVLCSSLDTFDGVLSGEFWVELDPLVETESGTPVTEEEAIRLALEEARYVFSGMIYGFSFTYVPSDRLRGVKEVFRLEPLAELTWGDPSLHVAEADAGENLFRILVRYHAVEHQVTRVESWQSNTFPSVKASGAARLLSGREAKYTAMSNAAKEAIRAHFRNVTWNKPKEITGELVFAEPPYIHIDAGEYVAALKIKIKLDELVPYRVY